MFPHFFLLVPEGLDIGLMELLHLPHVVHQIRDLPIFGVGERMELLLLLFEEHLRFVLLLGFAYKSHRCELHLGTNTGHMLLVLQTQSRQLDLKILDPGLLFGYIDFKVFTQLVVILESIVQPIFVLFVDFLQAADVGQQQ